MTWLIITGILTVLAIIFMIVSIVTDSYDNDVWVALASTCGLVGFLPFAIMLLTLAGIKSDFKAFETKYEFTKELVESYEKGDDYGNTFDLTEQILSINNTIAKHRAQWDSPWYNVWRCKEIGELEPLKLPQRNKRSE